MAVIVGGGGDQRLGEGLAVLVQHRPDGGEGVEHADIGELHVDDRAGAEARHAGDVLGQVEALAEILDVGVLRVDAVPDAGLQGGGHGVGVRVVREHRAHEVVGIDIARDGRDLIDDDLEQAVHRDGVLVAVHDRAEGGQAVAGVRDAGAQIPGDGVLIALEVLGVGEVGDGAGGAVAADVDGGVALDRVCVGDGGVVAEGHVRRVGRQSHRRAVGEGEGGVVGVLVADDVDRGHAVGGGEVVGGVRGLVDAGDGERAVGDGGGHALGLGGQGGIGVDRDVAVEVGGHEGRLALAAGGVDAVAGGGDGAVIDLALRGDENVLAQGQDTLKPAAGGAGRLAGRKRADREQQRERQNDGEESGNAFHVLEPSFRCLQIVWRFNPLI